MSNLSVFEFEGREVRFVGTADKPEWVAADVCAILEIKNVSYALTSFDEDERGIANVYTPGDDNPKGQEMLTVTEPGLYRLIFKSPLYRSNLRFDVVKGCFSFYPVIHPTLS
ncbi:Bro-N domain-containing protein [Nostoc sp. MG11]|uniref:BRO-N domain-containing protein n=1 Tax=Nostoc sp. MG11 TaxID=2721166 RepID=UPI001866C065|nr:Bro-N domain-containing protein [Nostoc sp. MG11]